MTVICPECGKELPEGTRFCTSCGQACDRMALKSQQRRSMDVAQTTPSSAWDARRGQLSQQPTEAFGRQPTMQIPAQDDVRFTGGTPGFSSAPTAVQPRVSGGGASFVPYFDPHTAQQASAVAAATGNSPAQERSRRTALIAVGIAAVLIVIVVAVAAWVSNANREASYNAQHAERHVTFSLDAPGYQQGKDSPIPVRISGTDLDGAQVDSVYFITPKQPTIGLRQGSYTASIAASPLLSDGTLYEVPSDLIDVQIREEDLSGGDLSWSFTKKAPIDITEDELDRAYDLALDSGMSADEAGALRDAIAQARQSALDKKAADDQAAADRATAEADQYAAEEAAANARNFDDGYVAMNIPDFWAGNYTYDTFGHTSGAFHTEIYLAGSDFMLLRIDGMDGDLSTYSATYTNAATEIWNSEHGGSRYWDSDLDMALYLQTGGAITRHDVLSCYDGYEAEALGEDYIGYFMDNNISPTVTTSRL